MRKFIGTFQIISIGLVLSLLQGCSTLGPLVTSHSTVDVSQLNVQRQLLITIKYNPTKKLSTSRSPSSGYSASSMYDLPQHVYSQLDKLQKYYSYEELDRWPLKSLGLVCIVVTPQVSQTRERLLSLMQTDRVIESVQTVKQYSTLGDNRYNDPYLSMQSHIDNGKLERVHQLTTGKNIRIAVIDTGADITHPDLKNNISLVRNFVDQNAKQFNSDIHGTAVLGIIAAEGGNQQGIVGIAPDAVLDIIKACWQVEKNTETSVCTSFTLAKALAFILESQPDVVNMSITGPYDPLLSRILQKITEGDIVVVAAVDESRANKFDPRSYGFPASEENVLAIRSSVGTRFAHNELNSPVVVVSAKAIIVAPGIDIFSTYPKGKYNFYTGSSMSTAVVSGLVGLLKEAAPSLSTAEIELLLQRQNKTLISKGVMAQESTRNILSLLQSDNS